jgi:hypothetical protein
MMITYISRSFRSIQIIRLLPAPFGFVRIPYSRTQIDLSFIPWTNKERMFGRGLPHDSLRDAHRNWFCANAGTFETVRATRDYVPFCSNSIPSTNSEHLPLVQYATLYSTYIISITNILSSSPFSRLDSLACSILNSEPLEHFRYLVRMLGLKS